MLNTTVNRMILSGVLLAGSVQLANAQENNGLFLSVPEKSTSTRVIEVKPTVLRQRVVALNPSVLPTATSAVGTVIPLNFFNNVDLSIVLSEVTVRDEWNFTWTGYVLGEEGSSAVTFVVNDDIVIANIRSDQHGYFQIRVTEDGNIAVHEIDESQYAGCTVDEAFNMPDSGESSSSRSFSTRGDTSAIFDVMVVYTPFAKTSAGGTAAIEAIIDLAVSEANEAYTNSGINSQMRLVHMAEIAYTESGNFGTDLERLQDTNDGYMDTVHTLRNTYGADMVSLFMEDSSGSGTAGLGYVMTDVNSSWNHLYAFNVVEYDTAIGNYTFAHELGHNMGCVHAVGDGGTSQGEGVFDYSHGWRFTGTSTTQFRTVMAYSPGARIPHFSNPSVLYDGVASGKTVGAGNQASNAKSINDAATEIASWRDAVEPLSILPYTDFNASGSIGGPFSPASATYTLTNTDDASAIDWTVSSSETWLSFSSTGGSIGSGASYDLVVSLGAEANSLSKGEHTATVTITDTDNSIIATRTVTLNVLLYSNSFDSDPGWATGAGWAFGVPAGGGGPNGNLDPTSGDTGSNVYGVNLSGNYGVVQLNSPAYLVSSAIDLSNTENTVLSFSRWLNHAGPGYFGTATVDVSVDTINWTSVYALSSNYITENSWSKQSYDISAVADGQSTVYVRWGYTTWIDSSIYYFAGWNIDDVEISGDYTPVVIPADLDEAWVDFDYVGTESGTEGEPFSTLAVAIAALKDDGTGVIKVKGDTADSDSDEVPLITKGMTLNAVGGTISIGTP